MDCPGNIFSTTLTAEQVDMEIGDGLGSMSPGPHAFLYIVEPGRYTQEDLEIYQRLKKVLGIMNGRMVVVFTHLDALAEDGTTPDDFINSLDADLRTVLKDCGWRYVFFDNKSGHRSQVVSLMNVIGKLGETQHRNRFSTSAEKVEADIATKAKRENEVNDEYRHEGHSSEEKHQLRVDRSDEMIDRQAGYSYEDKHQLRVDRSDEMVDRQEGHSSEDRHQLRVDRSDEMVDRQAGYSYEAHEVSGGAAEAAGVGVGEKAGPGPRPRSPGPSSLDPLLPEAAAEARRPRERTLVLVKPDGVERGLAGDVLRRFERRGFLLVAVKFCRPSEALVKKLYEGLAHRPFFGSLVGFMTSGPVLATVWEGRGVVRMARAMLGTTNPAYSLPGTIRGDLATDVERNVCHVSDSVASAGREIALWFKPEELLYDSEE